MLSIAWSVEYTDELAAWWETLPEGAQEEIDAIVGLLIEYGVDLPFPYSSSVNGSRHSHMRELRVQYQGDPIRILYAFDPLRTAILLIGGDKTGNKRWYKVQIPIADRLYDRHLEELQQEGRI